MVTSRKIGGDRVYPVGLGCMNVCHAYGPPVDREVAHALFRRALDLGCNFFDTATIYGLGESEKMIHEAVGDRRDELFLASKCVLGFKDGKRFLDGRPEAIKAACEASLKRLGTDVIDLYYMHRPDPKVPIEDSVGALSELVSEGKIRMIGLSEMGEGLLRRAHAVHPIAAMQSEYSLWARNPEIAVMDACKELGVTLVAFSPVGRGFLADPPADPASFHETDMRGPAFPRFNEEHYPKNLELLEVARECARQPVARSRSSPLPGRLRKVSTWFQFRGPKISSIWKRTTVRVRWNCLLILSRVLMRISHRRKLPDHAMPQGCRPLSTQNNTPSRPTHERRKRAL